MHKMTFYPLGNADCCLINMEDGKAILIDYADTKDREDYDDLRSDLPELLRDDLKARQKNCRRLTIEAQEKSKGLTARFYWDTLILI